MQIKMLEKYRKRLLRKQRLIRAYRRGMKDLTPLIDRTEEIKSSDILLFSTLKNEGPRLQYFLKYYRDIGVQHFCFVDNDSDDGGREYLMQQPDTSVWHSDKSYKRAAFGMHWLNYLMNKFAVGHWCLVVDLDEFFVYPHCDTRPLSALTDALDAFSRRSFGALLLDLYPKGDLKTAECAEGQNPVEVCSYFDSGNYGVKFNEEFQNLWVQGGVRQRVLFADKPEFAPALNKIPLVKWRRGNVYYSSTHTLLPRSLNITYCPTGVQRTCGALLHTKFVKEFVNRIEDKNLNIEHYAAGREYEIYQKKMDNISQFYTDKSVKYKGWQQLEELGLMSRGWWP